MPVLLAIAFIVVPLVELVVLIQVGQVIGVWWTIAILLIDSLVGAWLVKREGRSAWRNFRAALDDARIPTAEVVDGALVIFGGALLLTPGFVTDILGMLLLIPPSRAVFNRWIRSRVRGAFGLGPPRSGPRPTAGSTRPAAGRGTTRTKRASDDVLDVEVVKVERTKPPTNGPA